MLCLDSTFLIDYLTGRPAAKDFLEDRSDRPIGVPAPALYEAFVGGARLEGSRGIERIESGLSWAEPIPFTPAHAHVAALIDAELVGSGRPINVMDVLVAGTARSIGADLVSRDEAFARIDDLSVVSY